MPDARPAEAPRRYGLPGSLDVFHPQGLCPVRGPDRRPLVPVRQPGSGRGGPRDRGRAAPGLRAARHRSRRAVAMVGRGPDRHPAHPRLRRPERPATCRSAAPRAVPVGRRPDDGRPHGRDPLHGRDAGGVCRRPGELPPPGTPVEPDPPARVGRRGAGRRAGLQHPAGRARLAGRAGEAAAARRAGLLQRARPQAPRPEPAGERGAPGPGGGRRRGGALDPRPRHRHLLGDGAGSGAVRVFAGRSPRHGAFRGVGPSRRLGRRPGCPRAVGADRRAHRRGVPDRPPRPMAACGGSPPVAGHP